MKDLVRYVVMGEIGLVEKFVRWPAWLFAGTVRVTKKAERAEDDFGKVLPQVTLLMRVECLSRYKLHPADSIHSLSDNGWDCIACLCTGE